MERINGVPVHGGEAYREGVVAGDCPFMEEDPDFNRWNTEWDEAADLQMEIEKAARPPAVGSVITNRYRARYSEDGHPTHCGDALATKLNELCANKGGTNLELFEAICTANGVSLAKYKREGKGWQGRLRMTGRNLLAKKVAENGGKLALPADWPEPHHQFGKDWVEDTINKFKPRVNND